MWDQYKRTLPGMQTFIWLVSAAVLWLSGNWHTAATFFVVMQISAVSGAMWGVRLRSWLR